MHLQLYNIHTCIMHTSFIHTCTSIRWSGKFTVSALYFSCKCIFGFEFHIKKRRKQEKKKQNAWIEDNRWECIKKKRTLTHLNRFLYYSWSLKSWASILFIQYSSTAAATATLVGPWQCPCPYIQVRFRYRIKFLFFDSRRLLKIVWGLSVQTDSSTLCV